MTLSSVKDAPVCFASSTAYFAALCDAFEPSIGTRIFEIIGPPSIYIIQENVQYHAILSQWMINRDIVKFV